MKPQDLREQLLAAAEHAPPPEIDTDRVRTRVRRRRRARYAAVAGAGLAVAAAVVLHSLPSASAPEIKTPADSVIRPPAATSGTVPAFPPLTCGARIPADTGRGAVTVRVLDVRAAPDGTPQVTYSVNSTTAPAVLSGGPWILVLKDGRVVAGQDPTAPASGNTGDTTHRLTITPDRPHRARLAPVQGRPCGGTSWSPVWKGGYEVAVVLVTQHPASSGTRAPDAVIVTRTPLAG
ncbi:hypothetical protein JK359_06630 [Streptomyces actinomycinicus]|uniref:Uncharacterized protein n=1 Tax=Streptomyces actinomycinicus TaxID=1695166 RepID=A0A937JLU2_9ACTN|nr:hypothetical protein [Streptomyces actinomycinicus]MBL1081656.1 hypothetical protein [Streptomyces actinomycinicus]